MNLKNLLFASVIVLSANASFAQDSKVAAHLVTITVPQIALLDLEAPTTAITLLGTAPTEAGLPMTFGTTATNATIWMNYSSIVKGVLSRNVSVAITNGSVPTGLKLTVLASAASTDGAGTKGTALVDAHILTGTAKNIVTGIGSTYTGDGVNKGHNLTYQLGYATDEATDYAALRFIDTAAAPLTITYTLSDSL